MGLAQKLLSIRIGRGRKPISPAPKKTTSGIFTVTVSSEPNDIFSGINASDLKKFDEKNNRTDSAEMPGETKKSYQIVRENAVHKDIGRGLSVTLFGEPLKFEIPNQEMSALENNRETYKEKLLAIISTKLREKLPSYEGDAIEKVAYALYVNLSQMGKFMQGGKRLTEAFVIDRLSILPPSAVEDTALDIAQANGTIIVRTKSSSVTTASSPAAMIFVEETSSVDKSGEIETTSLEVKFSTEEKDFSPTAHARLLAQKLNTAMGHDNTAPLIDEALNFLAANRTALDQELLRHIEELANSVKLSDETRKFMAAVKRKISGELFVLDPGEFSQARKFVIDNHPANTDNLDPVQTAAYSTERHRLPNQREDESTLQSNGVSRTTEADINRAFVYEVGKETLVKGHRSDGKHVQYFLQFLEGTAEPVSAYARRFLHQTGIPRIPFEFFTYSMLNRLPESTELFTIALESISDSPQYTLRQNRDGSLCVTARFCMKTRENKDTSSIEAAESALNGNTRLLEIFRDIRSKDNDVGIILDTVCDFTVSAPNGGNSFSDAQITVNEMKIAVNPTTAYYRHLYSASVASIAQRILNGTPLDANDRNIIEQATLPYYQLKNGKLVSTVTSQNIPEDIEASALFLILYQQEKNQSGFDPLALASKILFEKNVAQESKAEFMRAVGMPLVKKLEQQDPNFYGRLAQDVMRHPDKIDGRTEYVIECLKDWCGDTAYKNNARGAVLFLVAFGATLETERKKPGNSKRAFNRKTAEEIYSTVMSSEKYPLFARLDLCRNSSERLRLSTNALNSENGRKELAMILRNPQSPHYPNIATFVSTTAFPKGFRVPILGRKETMLARGVLDSLSDETTAKLLSTAAKNAEGQRLTAAIVRHRLNGSNANAAGFIEACLSSCNSDADCRSMLDHVFRSERGREGLAAILQNQQSRHYGVVGNFVEANAFTKFTLNPFEMVSRLNRRRLARDIVHSAGYSSADTFSWRNVAISAFPSADGTKAAVNTHAAQSTAAIIGGLPSTASTKTDSEENTASTGSDRDIHKILELAQEAAQRVEEARAALSDIKRSESLPSFPTNPPVANTNKAYSHSKKDTQAIPPVRLNTPTKS